MYFTQDTEKRNGEPVYTGEDNNVRSLATSGPAAFETMRGPVNRHRIGHLLSNIAAWFFQCWTPRIPNMYGVRTRTDITEYCRFPTRRDSDRMVHRSRLGFHTFSLR